MNLVIRNGSGCRLYLNTLPYKNYLCEVEEILIYHFNLFTKHHYLVISYRPCLFYETFLAIFNRNA